ncbi:N-acetyl-gamma-glutamyl-phosphate reductase [bacterium]|nr:N-acetyl-gamma-glutamyl-phosphate reductase [bacterium]MCP5463215.1 N-acetyl-gamma-glutamyl-phosphate reductase [bacterium]
MIRVKVVGAGGYGGGGLLELLARHPKVTVKGVINPSEVGKPLGILVPHLQEFYDLIIQSPDDPDNTKDADVVFFATPDGVGMSEAEKYLNAGLKVIDYSGDFRFTDSADHCGYAAALGKDLKHKSPHLLENTVYGLPEINREKIARAQLVGNPGCFAVSCLLALAPVVKYELEEYKEPIICDCKTGVSGAGKKPNPSFHFPARYDTMNAYRLSGHQHVYEIERELSRLGNHPVKICFTPQVVPMCRGILSTVYVKIKPNIKEEAVLDAFNSFYEFEKFVRVCTPDQPVTTAWVRENNFCYLTLKFDEQTRLLLIVSHIDNLMKGQSSNAVQNMNVMFGLDETLGLHLPGMFP